MYADDWRSANSRCNNDWRLQYLGDRILISKQLHGYLFFLSVFTHGSQNDAKQGRETNIKKSNHVCK